MAKKRLDTVLFFKPTAKTKFGKLFEKKLKSPINPKNRKRRDFLNKTKADSFIKSLKRKGFITERLTGFFNTGEKVDRRYMKK